MQISIKYNLLNKKRKDEETYLAISNGDGGWLDRIVILWMSESIST